MSESSISAQRERLTACGYEFFIDPIAANMPDANPMPARAAVAAELCETAVQVTLAESPPISDLDLGQFGAYRYDSSRSTIWIRRPALEPAWQIEALRGPVLLHALALCGVFVLHASAARSPCGSLVAFTAQSGVGKSTLARIAKDLGWERVADDLLPIARRDGCIVALPHLPQPKLTARQQYPADAESAVLLTALIQLGRGAKSSLEPLTSRGAADLLLASTVATRVFAARSLVAHLAFAGSLAAEVAAGKLLVARVITADRPWDIAGAVREAIEATAASLIR